MKKFYLSFLTILLFVYSQGQTQEPVEKRKPFFIGVSYTYMSLDMKLKDLSIHTIWAGQDMGTHEFSSEDVDELNSFAERTATVNVVCIEAGMQLLSKPDLKWHIDGTVFLGIAQTYNRIYNKSTETEERTHNSGFSKPFFGLGFNVAYNFNPKWGFTLRPLFTATMGSSTEITDNYNQVPENFTQSLQDTYSTFYGRISLLGSFSTGNIKLYAGPGFYWLNSNHEYIIEQTNITTGKIIRDEINSKAIARSFIDGNIAVEWKIINQLTIHALASFGNDIFINSGIHYNF